MPQAVAGRLPCRSGTFKTFALPSACQTISISSVDSNTIPASPTALRTVLEPWQDTHIEQCAETLLDDSDEASSCAGTLLDSAEFLYSISWTKMGTSGGGDGKAKKKSSKKAGKKARKLLKERLHKALDGEDMTELQTLAKLDSFASWAPPPMYEKTKELLLPLGVELAPLPAAGSNSEAEDVSDEDFEEEVGMEEEEPPAKRSKSGERADGEVHPDGTGNRALESSLKLAPTPLRGGGGKFGQWHGGHC